MCERNERGFDCAALRAAGAGRLSWEREPNRKHAAPFAGRSIESTRGGIALIACPHPHPRARSRNTRAGPTGSDEESSVPITRAKHFPLSMQRRPLQPPAAADPPPAPANDEPPASALGITVALIAGAAIVAGVVFLAASSKVRGQRQQNVTRIDRIPSRAAASRPMSWHSTMAQTLIAQCTSPSWAMSSTSLQSAKCMRPEQAMDSSPARLVACLVLLKYHNKRQPTTGCILRLFDGFEYIVCQQI